MTAVMVGMTCASYERWYQLNGSRGEASSRDLPQRVRDEWTARGECTASGPWGIAHRPEWSVSAPSA
jgi:hypothetical protein